jgi:hypothetical protein
LNVIVGGGAKIVVSLVGGVVSLAERIAPDIQEVIERPAEENLDRRSAYERRCVVRPAQPAMLFIDCCDELPKILKSPSTAEMRMRTSVSSVRLSCAYAASARCRSSSSDEGL